MSDVLTRLTTALADRYTVVRELGAGGMATVYLAHDIKHERDVAIKVLHPDLGAALGADRFLSEIKTTAKLQHPHILPLLDSGAADGLLYYVMPYARGETLRARLEREKQLPIEDALRIAREVASALEHAHKQGIIHRDIKPENILLQDGAAVVADFGIALAVQSAGGARMTQTGLSLGTPQYMSPEQAMGERVIDARSDIYALSAVTYEMLVGDPPFTGSTLQAIIAKVVASEPERPSRVRKTVPAHIEDAVLRGLAKLPADRIATAREFGEALSQTNTRAFAAQETHAGLAPARDTSRVPWPIAGIASFAGAGAVALVWALQPSAAATESASVTTFTIEETAGLRLTSQAAPDFVFSRDGKSLLFNAIVNDRTQYMRRRFDAVDAEPLDGASNAAALIESPTGTELLVWDGADGRLITSSGDRTTSKSEVAVKLSRLGTAWTTQGIVIGADSSPSMFVFDKDGSKRRELFVQKKGVSPRWPVSIGASDLVLYSAYDAAADSAQLMAGFVGTGDTHPIGVSGYMVVGVARNIIITLDRIGGIFATRFDAKSGRSSGESVQVGSAVEMAASGLSLGYATLSGNGDLAYRTPASSTVLELADAQGHRSLLLKDTLLLEHPRWSPDARRVIVTVMDSVRRRRAVWMLDRTTGMFAALLPSVAAETDRASFTPDGKNVLYRRIQGGSPRYWLHALDGNAPDMPASPRGVVAFEADMAPDSRTLLGRLSLIGPQELFTWQRDDSTGASLTRYSDMSSIVGGPRISPNGQWATYNLGRGDGNHIYVSAFPKAGALVQVDRDGAAMPVWGPDGKSVYHSQPQRIEAVALTLGATASVGGARAAVTGLFTLNQNSRAQFDVARDGTIVMVNQLRGPRIVVVRNFIRDAELKLNAGAAR